jgi:GNAT superfamily N-acetyltransferase
MRLQGIAEQEGEALSEFEYKVSFSRMVLYLKQHLLKDLFVVLSLDEYGTPVSFMTLQIYNRLNMPQAPEGRYAELYGLFTKPEYRQQGYAKDVMKKMRSEIEELGLTFFEFLKLGEESTQIYNRMGMNAMEFHYGDSVMIYWFYASIGGD